MVVNDLGGNVDGSGAPTQRRRRGRRRRSRRPAGRAVANHDSVADFAAAERIIETAVKEFGAIDILVNNAGILRDRMIFNMSEEDWDAVIAVHLKGTFNCTRHAAVHMREQRRGRIISHVVDVGPRIGNPGQANYGAAKDGIAGHDARRSRATSARYGITVNAVCPGAGDAHDADGAATPRAQARQKARHPDARGGDAPSRSSTRARRTSRRGRPTSRPTRRSDVNGQIFFVMGGLIALLNDPAPVRTITDGRPLDARGDRDRVPTHPRPGPREPRAAQGGVTKGAPAAGQGR